jgi:hypothetical protein
MNYWLSIPLITNSFIIFKESNWTNTLIIGYRFNLHVQVILTWNNAQYHDGH